MKVETIISIIFIVLFVVIPFLREMFKKEDEGQSPQDDSSQDNQSSQQIREYLEKLRAGSGKPPVSRQKSRAMYDETAGRKPIVGKKPKEVIPQSVPESLTIQQPVAMEPEKIVAPVSTGKVDVIHNLFANTKFSEVQKAVIFHELFRTPSTFEKEI